MAFYYAISPSWCRVGAELFFPTFFGADLPVNIPAASPTVPARQLMSEFPRTRQAAPLNKRL